MPEPSLESWRVKTLKPAVVPHTKQEKSSKTKHNFVLFNHVLILFDHLRNLSESKLLPAPQGAQGNTPPYSRMFGTRFVK